MANTYPVIDETFPTTLFRCSPDSNSEEAYVMQHGISIAREDEQPHITQFRDPSGLFWPCILLAQDRDQPRVFTHKSMLSIWAEGGSESNLPNESDILATDLIELVKCCPSKPFCLMTCRQSSSQSLWTDNFHPWLLCRDIKSTSRDT